MKILKNLRSMYREWRLTVHMRRAIELLDLEEHADCALYLAIDRWNRRKFGTLFNKERRTIE